MLLSAPTNSLSSRLDDKTIIDLLKNAGFDAYDYSFYARAGEKDALNNPDYLEYAKSLREYADNIGMSCNQAHAPFHSSNGNPEWDEIHFNQIVRSIEMADILGVKNIIVHPKQHLTYSSNIKELEQLNLEFFTRLLKVTEHLAVNIAIENMWQMDPNISNKITFSTCAAAEEFCRYVDMLNNPRAVACLDIGHVSLVEESMVNMIHSLGNRLKCLHIHDTNRVSDLHTLPYLGSINYEEVLTALAEINYQGDFTFECKLSGVPEPLIPDAAGFMCKIGRHLISRFEEIKKGL